MTEDEFRRISALVKRLCGINLRTGKQELVKARLGKRLRELGLSDFEQYLDHVERDETGDELTVMLDSLSTNVTSFFREPPHFAYLRERILPRLTAERMSLGRRLRVWSAGCSSGEEVYSVAICVHEGIPDLERWDAKILATDLSTQMLARVREGVYDEHGLRDVAPALQTKYFRFVDTEAGPRYRVANCIRRLVHVARLNLTGLWPMHGPFDLIVCRNVMIYFDRPTQAELVSRFDTLLRPGGTLFVGHAESLAGVPHNLRYIQPAVYEKPESP